VLPGDREASLASSRATAAQASAASASVAPLAMFSSAKHGLSYQVVGVHLRSPSLIGLGRVIGGHWQIRI